MIRSHKARLTATASVATGLLLGILFIAVYHLAYNNARGQKLSELKSALAALVGDPASLEIDEFKESHANLSLTVYGRDGAIAYHYGSLSLPARTGLFEGDVAISYGAVRGSQTVVAGDSLTELQRAQSRLALVLELLWLPLTLFVGIVTWLSAKLTFRPLERLSQQAAEIQGQFIGRRLVTQDHAEFGRFADQLNRMLDRIEETVKREDQFASDAAHEFRTPLAIMRTRIETTLLRERSSEEYIESNRSLLVELDRLTRIVESLLRTARRIPTVVDTIEMEPLIQELANAWQHPYIEAEVFLSVQSEPCTARIAAEEVSVIMNNLLDNALRFAPKGSKVTVRLYAGGANTEWLVSDEGPGVPEDLGDRIFERLVRSDDSRNRASGGSGIGLAVCRKILQSRGGSIEIRRPEGSSGATFVCTVPRI